MNPIDNLARAFVSASAALGDALLAQLAQSDPELAAKVAHAVESGERIVIGFEFAGDESAVRLMTIDDYQRVKRVMAINAAGGTKH